MAERETAALVILSIIEQALEDNASVRRYECEHCGEQGGDDVVGACFICDTDCCRDNCAIWEDGELYCPDCSKECSQDKDELKNAAEAWDEKAKNNTPDE